MAGHALKVYQSSVWHAGHAFMVVVWVESWAPAIHMQTILLSSVLVKREQGP